MCLLHTIIPDLTRFCHRDDLMNSLLFTLSIWNLFRESNVNCRVEKHGDIEIHLYWFLNGFWHKLQMYSFCAMSKLWKLIKMTSTISAWKNVAASPVCNYFNASLDIRYGINGLIWHKILIINITLIRLTLKLRNFQPTKLATSWLLLNSNLGSLLLLLIML